MPTRETTIRLSVSDNFSAQLRAFASAVDKADKETSQLGKSAATAAQGTNQLGSSLGQIASGLGLSLGLAGVTAAMVSIGKQSVELGAKMEQTELAFETLTGSVAKAEKHLGDLRDFAKTTPFEFNDLVDASRKLHAFGFETSQILPMLRDLGDASAAMGANAETINRITIAIGQMSGKGKVSAQEMLQLTEAGIPAWRYLADSIGVSTAEVQKLTEKGLIPADQAIQSILMGMRQDFGGQMAKQANTAAQAMSNLNDKWTQYLTLLGQNTQGTQKGVLGFLDGLVNNLLEVQEQQKLLNDMQEAGLLGTDKYNEYSSRLTQGFVLQDDVIQHLTNVYDDYLDRTDESALSNQILASTLHDTRDDIDLTAKSMELLKLETEYYKSKVSELHQLMQGPVAKENETYYQKQRDISAVIGETRDKISELESRSYLTATQKEELDGLHEELGGLKKTFEENATAHEESMRRIMFSLLEGRLAVDGFTKAEYDLLTGVGEAWGIFDEQTAGALRSIDDALAEFNEGDINNTIVKLGTIFGFPTEKTYSIRVNYQGPDGAMMGDSGLGGDAPVVIPGGSGSGGTTGTPGGVGQQAIGGEYVVSRPTTFVAGDMGTERVSITPMSGSSSSQSSKSGGDQYFYTTINTPIDEEMFIARVAERLKNG